MKAKTKIAGLMVALMMLAVPFVYADNGGGDKDWHQDGAWHHEGNPEEMMAKILNLTSDQEKQLKSLHESQEQTMKTTMESMKSIRQAFESEIVKANADMSKINDLQNQLKTIQGQMADNHLNSLLAVKKILTPEQFAGFMALKKEKELKMHKMHGFRPDEKWHKDGDHKADADQSGPGDQD